MSLEEIIRNGNDPLRKGRLSNWIVCADGFKMSVIANWGAYCEPRPVFKDSPLGPFTAVEVGFPSKRPEPWESWEKFCEDEKSPTGTVYGFVPVDLVRSLVAAHGGEK